MFLRNIFFTFILALSFANAYCTEWQTSNSIQEAAEEFIAQKTTGIDGEVSISSTPPDSRVKVAKCNKLETSLPANNRLWGKTSVKVSCSGPSKWTLYVPVSIKVIGKALVATRAISGGQVIDAQDVAIETLDLTPFPIGVFKSPEQAIGKTTATTIAAGAPLRAELLRAALAIRQGQQVVVIAQGTNFKVSAEGQAMGNAQVGQVVAVKTKSGQIVKGVAKSEGVVEVSF